jgi:hypothetical protein
VAVEDGAEVVLVVIDPERVADLVVLVADVVVPILVATAV